LDSDPPGEHRHDALSAVSNDTIGGLGRHGHGSTPSGQGRCVCCVVVVVVDVTGAGVVVVVCSVVVVRLTVGGGAAQLASTAVPAISAVPTARPKRDGLSIIV